ncbi:Mur ligase domain-containing protein, partial [Aeromonas hydrophila]|uniref:Mur ligase domain-containing protein n=2 Tax=Aeromonadaceae TaxID=84642 RepID=UPI0038D25103
MRCRQRCPPNLPVRRLLLSRALDALLRPFGIQAPALTLTDIQLDSRRVGSGSLFVAIRGHQVDGRRF